MAEEGTGGGSPVGKVVVIAVIVAALVGAVAGYFAGGSAAGNRASPTPQSRTFYVFSTVLGFNETLETQWGLPHDSFYPDTIVVNKGDDVTIKFYNTEDEAEDHTFTIGAPYNQNVLVAQGNMGPLHFKASTAGVFEFQCTLHQPTMTGRFIVLG